MKKYILFFLLGLNSHFVSAGDFEQGMQFFEQKNYIQAKKIWQPLAEDGDARAQYNMALILFNHEKNKTTRNQLQRRQKANQYLAMSRAGGLVDSYFLITPVDVSSVAVESDAVKQGKNSSDTIDSLSWLNQQQKTHYTLQLATGKNRDSMEKSQKNLLASQLLEQPENLYIQEFKRKENDKTIISYVLLYGTFESYQRAKNEVEKLPESLKKSNPWIRQFGKLQSRVAGKQ